VRALASLVLAVILGGCVGPARTSESYTKKASGSVHDSRSAVETARLAVDAAQRDRATGAYLSVLAGIALALELATSVSYLLWIPFTALAVWLVIWWVRFETIEQAFGLAGLCLLASGPRPGIGLPRRHPPGGAVG
jgi:hypothetical protein